MAACVAPGPEPVAGEVPTGEALEAYHAGLETCDLDCTIQSWMAEERYAEAREVLSHELQLAPDDVETVLLMTRVDIADEEYDAAYALAHRSLEQEPDTRLMAQRARASLLADDVATAVEDYQTLIDALQVPEGAVTHAEARAWVGLATAQYNRGELAEAEAIANDLLRDSAFKDQLDPAYGQFVLALAASKRGDDTGAAEQYGAILKRYPREPSSLNNMGCISYRAGDLDEAREYHMAAFEAAGSNRRLAAIAWSNVGEIDMLRGDYLQAENKWHEALATSKRFAAGHFNLAVLYDIQGKGEQSARHMRTALDIDEQGVTRWNTSWFTPEWKTHFDALIAEADGQRDTAQGLWQRLQDADEKALARTAGRHLTHFNP
ncbi:MAG: tetratricopeptide (TPR) repeat protein [Myxococcota bacterium]|jgi:tetratricopeptide (TPR) repeat protein